MRTKHPYEDSELRDYGGPYDAKFSLLQVAPRTAESVGRTHPWLPKAAQKYSRVLQSIFRGPCVVQGKGRADDKCGSET